MGWAVLPKIDIFYIRMIYTGYYKFHKPGFFLQVLLTSVHFKLITEPLVIWYFLEEDIWLLSACFFTSYNIYNSDYQTRFNEPRVDMPPCLWLPYTQCLPLFSQESVIAWYEPTCLKCRVLIYSLVSPGTEYISDTSLIKINK